MPNRYTIHRQHRYVDQVFEDAVDFEAIVQLVDRIVRDPEWDPEFNGIVDFTDARLALTFDEANRLANLLKKDSRNGRGRCAFVVADALNHGLVRMFDALWEHGTEVEFFRNRAEAEHWIRQPARAE